MSIENSKISQAGQLYVVATPIGNLDDISLRAIDILKSVDLILAEDTRHSRSLMTHLGVQTPLRAHHEHNEDRDTETILEQLAQGKDIALISDAGTPLVSDPGYRLVSAAQKAGIRLVPVPGPCAAITGLSVSGLPTDRFAFEGFPPAKQGARLNYFKKLQNEERTLVFYASCHRLKETIQDMVSVFGGARSATMARELTKLFETVKNDTLSNLSAWVDSDPNQSKGEIVIMVSGNPGKSTLNTEVDTVLSVLLKELSVKKASILAAELTGENKKELYARASELKKNE